MARCWPSQKPKEVGDACQISPARRGLAIRAEKLTMQPAGESIMVKTSVEGIMDQFYHDYTQGTVSFREAAYLCKLTTHKFWELIKSLVVINYPNLNEFWMSIAPMCLSDDAVPPERILNARFPLQEVLEFAVMEDYTESVEDVIISILTKYKKLYPRTNYNGDITVNTNAVASSSVDIMNSNNVNINGVTAEQMEEIIRAITQNAQRGAAPLPDVPPEPPAPEADTAGEEAQASDPSQKVNLRIPNSLWAGKSPHDACESLKKSMYSNDAVIAYILVKRLNRPKAEVGRILYHHEEREPHEKENTTYRKSVDRLLGQADSLYTFTFTE
jgi:hypothetical protein